MDQAWDPKVLTRFRKEHGLNKSDMVRLMTNAGLEALNWSTYNRWEAGTHDPRPAYRKAIYRALAQIERQRERAS